MLNSLYSGITGMKAQQTKMDVLANNIANVNTTGFKSQRVRFQDMISQMDSNAQGPNGNGRGGINAQQVGLGSSVSATDLMMQGGALQFTGRALDFGIQNGDNSFFVVSQDGNPGGRHQYTRDGGFYTDYEGNLTTANGMRVMGFSTEIMTEESDYDATALTQENNFGALSIPQTYNGLALQDYSIDDTGTIIGTYSDGNAYIIGRLALSTFTNADGLEKAGENLYNASTNSGAPTIGGPTDDGFGTVRSGFTEMSNVDLATEFTEMIVASRAYQANTRSITTSDEMLQELINLKR
ncbi:flagellar hook-basal body complex protein [Alkalibacterium iburiense]|uniref:Flagellar hook protein FlgE n=1 Tax=Alkalibacterium iburiense TaxID=290589 RepID=A0ABP3H721_9LACT